MPPAGAVESSAAAELVGEALSAVRGLDADELQAVLQRAAVTLGGPLFLDEVVAPAVEAVGDGWAGGSLSVAQEHMSSAVFRRVLEWLVRGVPGGGRGAEAGGRDSSGRRRTRSAPSWWRRARRPRAGGLPIWVPTCRWPSCWRRSGTPRPRAVALSIVYSSNDEELLAAVEAARVGLPEGTPLLVGGAAASQLRDSLESLGAIVLDSLPELRARLRELGEAE